MRKLIIVVTILSFLNLIGCYYQEQMNPSDYAFDEKSTMEVTTKDTVYNFSGDDYYMINDTLIGKASISLDARTTIQYHFDIPIEDIEEVEVERTDVLATVLITFGVVVGVFFVGFLDL